MCKAYQFNTLNRQLYRHRNISTAEQEDPSSHTNYRYLDHRSKNVRMKKLNAEVKSKTRKLARVQSLLKEAVRKESVILDQPLHKDLFTIMDQQLQLSSRSSDDISKDFKQLFWGEQLKAFSAKNKRSVRWHPLIIKWCLYLHHRSSGAYEALRNSGQ